MGAKHPMAVVSQLKANKNEFILAARHLVRTGVAKSPGDAIRYMEEHNINVENIIDDLITTKLQAKQESQPTQEDE
tara:strand:+ start:96 stop:323 length:228 start_codon:yes stop_codon:yes gene_type:complete